MRDEDVERRVDDEITDLERRSRCTRGVFGCMSRSWGSQHKRAGALPRRHRCAMVVMQSTRSSFRLLPRLQIRYLYISSNGLVSLKQLSHTSFTILAACTSSLQPGLFMTDNVALLLTHSCSCCVSFHCPLVQNSRPKRHSPDNVDARIYDSLSATRPRS